MKVLSVLDSHDYDVNLPVFKRTAVRAIIIKSGRLMLIKSDKYGEYKFAGGGMEKGETFIDTLIRETREETGLVVIPSSIKEYGIVREIRLGSNGDSIFDHSSYYYTCDARDDVITETKLDDYEAEYGYKLYCVDIDDAIKNNENLKTSPLKMHTMWLERELFVFKCLKENLLAGD